MKIIAKFVVTKEKCEECLKNAQSCTKKDYNYAALCAIAVAAQDAGVTNAEVNGDGLYYAGKCYLHTKETTNLMCLFDAAATAYNRHHAGWSMIVGKMNLPVTLYLVDKETFQEITVYNPSSV